MSMELVFEHTLADLEAWWRFSSTRGAGYRLTYWSFAVLGGAGGLWIAIQFDASLPFKIALVAAGAFLGWGLAVVSARVWVRDVARASSSSVAAQQDFGIHRLRVDGEGVAEHGPSASHTHSWRAVEALHETPDHFFIAVGAGSAYVIPKRGLAHDVQAEFKAAVTSRLSEASRRTMA
jgi:hypothetical protein